MTKEPNASVYLLATGEVQTHPASECRRLKNSGAAISVQSGEYKTIKRLLEYTTDDRWAVLLCHKRPPRVPKRIICVYAPDFLRPLEHTLFVCQGNPDVRTLVIQSLRPFVVEPQLPESTIRLLINNSGIIHGYSVVYPGDSDGGT